MSRKALGKGLEALIPRPAAQQTAPDGPAHLTHRTVPIEQIVPNPRQPRRQSDPEKLEELVQSVRTHGIIEPLIVRQAGDRIELIAGERRLRAAKEANLERVPVIFVDVDDIASFELALIENIQREDLNPLDEARPYQVMVGEFRRTHDQIAEQVGKSRTTITNLLRMLRLPEDLLAMVADGRLSGGHARALLAVEDPHLQSRLAAKIVTNGWSVRQIEQQIGKKEPRKTRGHQTRDPHYKRVEEAIRRRVGTDARLHLNKRGGGRLELIYGDREDLERVLEILGVQVY